VLKYPLALLLVSILGTSAACSRGEGPDQAAEGAFTRAGAQGNDAALDHVRAAARALAQADHSVEYVAAEMEGVVMARTKSRAVMHYDGYRATLTTPGNQVTQVMFELIEAKPSIGQLTGVFGEPEEVRKGMRYQHTSAATGANIVIFAEPVSMPADEGSLVRRIFIEGARRR
jgi:hypothetical protein